MHKNRREITYKINDNGCFECNSHASTGFGHCRVKRNGKSILIHRLIYEECFGEIPKGKVVRHVCHNPKCINPEHLKIGEHKDNVQDKVDSNRQMQKEKHHNARLTQDNVDFIRNSSLKNKELAEMFDVHIRHIFRIKSKERWK